MSTNISLATLLGHRMLSCIEQRFVTVGGIALDTNRGIE